MLLKKKACTKTSLSCNAQRGVNYFFFLVLAAATVALKVAPAENFGMVVAAILIFSPVFGFLPSRAARSAALKEPKPTRLMPSLLAIASTMLSMTTKLKLKISKIVIDRELLVMLKSKLN